jgi:virulence-associated protein VagC
LKQIRREKNMLKALKTFSDNFMENGREQPEEQKREEI